MMEKPEPFLPVGQTAVIHLIQRMVLSDRAGGSYLFIGPKGVGKTMAARFFAMAVNCLATSSRPCGHCEACVKILENVHPDLLTLSPEPKKQTISIEQIRQIQETLAFAPYEGKRRLVIIEPADRLGPEAANALLLTLEAPPAHTIFILVTATPYALLDTIRSRCQIIRFSPLTQEALLEVGRHHGLSLAPGDPLLEQCQGSVTHLLRLASPDQLSHDDEMEKLIVDFLTGNASRGLIETPKWAKQRTAMEEFLEQALWVVRNMWISLEGKGKNHGKRDRGALGEAVSRLKPEASERLIHLLETILEAMEDLKHNGSPELIFDMLRLEMEAVRG
jgi:DNA polymerase-3 subunit delta'